MLDHNFYSGRILFAPIGFLFLLLRYRNFGKMKQVLKDEYDGDYAKVGAIIFSQTLAGMMLVMMGGGLILLLGKTIYDLFRGRAPW